MTKYRTVKDLAEAFRSGELDRSKYVLIVDNDSSFLQYIGDDMSIYESVEHCHKLYRGGGKDDAIEAHEAAGIPCDGA